MAKTQKLACEDELQWEVYLSTHGFWFLFCFFWQSLLIDELRKEEPENKISFSALRGAKSSLLTLQVNNVFPFNQL